jgi:hypothetical protein
MLLAATFAFLSSGILFQQNNISVSRTRQEVISELRNIVKEIQRASHSQSQSPLLEDYESDDNRKQSAVSIPSKFEFNDSNVPEKGLGSRPMDDDITEDGYFNSGDKAGPQLPLFSDKSSSSSQFQKLADGGLFKSTQKNADRFAGQCITIFT